MMSEPVLIQGGMGIGVSNWQLAKAVSVRGQLGVVSGTAMDTILVRRLQDGDLQGHMRRALKQLPLPHIADELIDKYYIPGGKKADEPYRLLPMHKYEASLQQLNYIVAANFVEVYLAKEGHNGVVGINYLEKIQIPTLPSLYGAMLANVDYVLMGAGIPKSIPGILDDLAMHKAVSLKLNLDDAMPDDNYRLTFDPKLVNPEAIGQLKRPKFLAIISSHVLATTLAKKSTGHVDGFVIENHTAGGHNAPPRGTLNLDAKGNPLYGEKDEANLEEVKKLNLPFWLAGSFNTPQKLNEALALGASGIQVGTPFAFCEESGFEDEVKRTIIEKAVNGNVEVCTDALASPTNFPFKVVQMEDSLSDDAVYQNRQRLCDLGYLRKAYKKADGSVGLRCPGEPVDNYLKKDGDIADTVGRKCICNALLADVGLGQVRPDGYEEQHLVTSGDELLSIARYVKGKKYSYKASDVVDYLLASVKELV